MPMTMVRWFPAPGLRKGEPVLDWWTLPHVASGVVLAFTLHSWLLSLALLVVYEVFEALLRRIKTKSGAGVFEYESWPNIVADVVIGMIGWVVARLAMIALGVAALM